MLVTDDVSRQLLAWLTVLIGLTAPCVYVLVRRSLLAALPASWCRPADDERNTLYTYLDAPGDEDNPLKAIRAVWRSAAGGQNALPVDGRISTALRNFRSRWWHSVKVMWQDLFSFSIPLLLFLALFVGAVTVQIYGTDLAEGSTVSFVRGNAHAGDWQPDSRIPSFDLKEGYVGLKDRQIRVWQYKRACYGDIQPDKSCQIMVKSILPSIYIANASCPFAEETCLHGKTGAYTRTTGLADSNIIGINAHPSKRVFWRKSLHCSPVITEKQVKKTGGQEYPNEYLYDYGKFVVNGRELDNFTHRNAREWWLEATDDDAFTIHPVIFIPGSSAASNFDPYSQFRAGEHPVTLIFVRSAGGWYYARESLDPVFPARQRLILEIVKGYKVISWVNYSTKAGILGCVDMAEICLDAMGEKCWPLANRLLALEELRYDPIRQQIFYLVSVALQRTSAWHMLNYLGASVLDATQKSAGKIVVQFAEDQWKVEVDNIFNASLAAVQLRAYDYAQGTYYPRPGGMTMRDATPPILQRSASSNVAMDISKHFKYNDSDYRSISVLLFWFINIACLLVFLGSCRFSTAAAKKHLISHDHDHGYHDSLWVYVFSCWVWQTLRRPLILLWQTLSNPVQQLWSRLPERLRRAVGRAISITRKALPRDINGFVQRSALDIEASNGHASSLDGTAASAGSNSAADQELFVIGHDEQSLSSSSASSRAEDSREQNSNDRIRPLDSSSSTV